MELDELKRNWADTPAPLKTNNELLLMLQENRHPVLKRIRKQLTIEITGWAAFLLAYYSAFDGAEKPLPANIILILAVLTALVHNLTGYNFSKYIVQAGNITQSLQLYLKKVKLYATLSIASRVIFISGLLVFFCWNVVFDERRYLLLGAGIIALIIQLFILGKLWGSRLKMLSTSLNTFAN